LAASDDDQAGGDAGVSAVGAEVEVAASAVTAKSKKKQKGKKGKAAPVPRTEVARLVRAMRPVGQPIHLPVVLPVAALAAA
jgi:hypothetical protein